MAFTSAQTAATDLLKNVYRGPVKEALNQSNILLKFAKRRKRDYLGGKLVYIPLHHGRNVGTGNAGETAALPTAGVQQYKHAEYTVKQLYGTIEITGLGLALTESNVGSFVSARESEIEGLQKDMKKMVNRIFWHDGSSILTRCKASNNTVNIEVESTKHLTGGASGVGQEIEIRNGTDGASVVTARFVSSVTDADTFVISGAAITTDANDVVIGKAQRDGTSGTTWGLHADPWGIEALFSNANPGNGLTDLVGNLTRTGNIFWQQPIKGNSGTLRPVTLDGFQECLDEVDILTGYSEDGQSANKTPLSLALTNHALRRRMAGLLLADRRFKAGSDVTLDGGYKGIDYDGVPIISDADAGLANTPQKLNRIYIFNLDGIEFLCPPGRDFFWLDEDGSMLKMKPGTNAYLDAWQAYMGLYCELAVTGPNSGVVYDDLEESA